MSAEENPLGPSQASRERHHGPLVFVPSCTRSVQVPETFSASTHHTIRTRTTGQVTTKLRCTCLQGASQRCPSRRHATLRRRGTWYAAGRTRYTQRKSQNTREDKSYGMTKCRRRRNSHRREASYHQKWPPVVMRHPWRRVALEDLDQQTRSTTTTTLWLLLLISIGPIPG